jgi:hypothetical protein
MPLIIGETMFGLLILILVLALLFSGFRGRDWGYGPFGGLFGLVLLLVILRVFGLI